MESTEPNLELDSIRMRLSEVEKRLDRVASVQQEAIQSVDPSLDRFSIAEAIVDELFDTGRNEKACTFEPNGKPCDHCSMCSARGF